jgi:tetratricopeptide (TPR) repeat protein
MPTDPPATTRIYGSVYGLVQGDNNTVTLVFEGGSRTVPFLAPPMPAHAFVGRVDLLGVLRNRLLTTGTTALSALNGLPGVGKTTTAIALAHDGELLAHFADGVLWAGLGPAPDTVGQLAAWGAAVGLDPADVGKPAGPAQWARAVHAAIGLRRMLLVVDDAWTEEAALLFRLGGPNCARLLTTRFPEIAVEFAGDGAQRVEEMTEDEGLALLKAVAAGALPEDDPGIDAQLRELVRMVGALPLALTLVGGMLRRAAAGGRRSRLDRALADLRAAEPRLRISRPQSPVGASSALPPEAPLSMGTVLDFSTSRLTASARAMLATLSLFPPKPNTFSTAAVLAVSEGEEADLDELVDVGLMEVAAEDRYTLHQTISDYARVVLARDHEGTVGDRARAQFVRHFADQAEAWHAASAPGTADVRLEPDFTNLAAALALAWERGMHADLVRGARAAYQLWEARGQYQTAEIHLARALDAAGELGDLGAEAFLLLGLGIVREQRGAFDAAEPMLRRAIDKAAEAGDRGCEGDSLVKLGWLVGMRGDLSEAEQLFVLAGERGLPRHVSRSLQGRGWVHGQRGDYASGRRELEEGLALAVELGDESLAADVRHVLAWVIGPAGDYAGAAREFEACLAVARATGRRDQVISSLQGLSWVMSMRGDRAGAIRVLDEARSVAVAVQHQELTPILVSLASNHRSLGNLIEAERYLREAAATTHGAEADERRGRLLLELGYLAAWRGEYGEAEASMREALEIAYRAGIADFLVSTQVALADVVRRLGRADEARALLSAAEATDEARQNPITRALLAQGYGELALDAGLFEDAAAAFADQVALAREGGDERLAGIGVFARARLAKACGDVGEAVRTAQDALRALRDLTAPEAPEVEAWLDALAGGAARE